MEAFGAGGRISYSIHVIILCWPKLPWNKFKDLIGFTEQFIQQIEESSEKLYKTGFYRDKEVG